MHLAITDLFPTALASVRLGRAFTDDELAFIDSEATNTLKFDSLMGKNLNILDDPRLSDIKKFIEEAANQYLKEVMSSNTDASLYVTQSWLNIVSAGNNQGMHIHPNSFLTGVIYIKVPLGIEGLVFHKHLNYIGLRVDPEVRNKYNEEDRVELVQEGQVLIFPSNLMHGTLTHASVDTPRVAIAFNTFIRGTVGSMYGYNELTLS
jgi:uncharacterized protein (TIGR02466 family)